MRIDLRVTRRLGVGFADHNNVVQAARRSGDLRAVRDATRAREVLFRGAVPQEAITLIQ